MNVLTTLHPRPAAATVPAAAPTARPPAAQPSPAVHPAGAHPPLAAMVARVRAERDPQRRAVLHDHLARTVADHLGRAGHKVSWKGEHLMVDGRPYVLAGQEMVTPDPATTDAPARDTSRAAAPHVPVAPVPHAKVAAAAQFLAARHQAERRPDQRAALAQELARAHHHLAGGR